MKNRLIQNKIRLTPGQSIQEYTLAISLVGVIAIASLVTMGGWTEFTFGNMITNRSAPPAPGPIASLPPAGAPPLVASPTLPPSGTTPLPTTGIAPLTLSNYPVDLASTVETSGIDGAMKQYADAIEELANKLKDEELSEEQYQRLITFAALIRRNPKMTELLTSFKLPSAPACDPTTTPSGGAAAGVGTNCTSVDAENLKAKMFAEGIGMMDEDTEDKLLAFIEDPNDSNLPFDSTNSYQYQITQLLVQINKDGTLKNPDAKQLISDAAMKSLMLAGQIGNTLKSGQANNIAQLTDKVVADLKKTDMKQIVNCSSGNGGLQFGNNCLKK